MRNFGAVCFLNVTMLLMPQLAMAQAFGEYGRAVGSIPRGPSGAGGSGGTGSGTVGDQSVRDVGGRALPTRLIVTAKDAGLFPRQDEETLRTAQLAEGEKLVPLVQSEGRNHWYMVKTETGLIGWVKSTDVRPETKGTK